MSIAALNWAFHQPIMGAAKAVLIVLADHVDQDGWCWPTVGRIGFRAGLCERAVRTALRQLEAAGVIVAEIGVGRGRVSRYCVLHNQDVCLDEPREQASEAPEKGQEMPLKASKGAPDAGFIKGAPDALKGAKSALKGAADAPKPLRTTKKNHQGGTRARRAPAAPKWVWDEIQEEIGMRSLLLPPIPEPPEDNRRAYPPRVLQ